jgi:hypothetical protein
MMEFTTEDRRIAKALSLGLTISRGISEIAGKDCIYYPLNSLQPLIDLLDKIGEEEPEQKEEPVNRMHTTYTTMLTQEGIVYDLAKRYSVQPKDVVIEVQKNGTVGATITNIPAEAVSYLNEN